MHSTNQRSTTRWSKLVRKGPGLRVQSRNSIPLVNTVPHGDQMEKLVGKRWGLELRAETLFHQSAQHHLVVRWTACEKRRSLDDDDVELNVLGCRVDTLGTNCDQCVCMVQYSFTSTETVRFLRTGSPGRGAQDGHLDFHREALSSARNPLFHQSVGLQHHVAVRWKLSLWGKGRGLELIAETLCCTRRLFGGCDERQQRPV